AADAPYAAYIECDDHAIVSASPELFFRLNGEHLISKPMKGTARRGLASADDLEARRRLYESQKNRAENVMITDMVRNDMGRIAAPGSVQVPRLFETEKYPTVWQMTSTVSVQTKAPVAGVFRALFPCASVTGAPKVSSMAIIAGLEDTPREVYTGAIGFMAPDRQARFNVAIRTAIVDRHTGEAVYGVGGGIVWDSDPDEEYQECLAKARILSTPDCGQAFELLETMLWTPDDGYFLLDKHLNRMRASAGYFDFEFDRAEIEKELAGIAERLPRERHRIRLLLQRDGRIHSVEAPLVDADSDRPRRLVPAREPIDSSDPFLYHKTTRREVYEQALRSAGDADDVLLWNEDGYITETGIANVIVRLDGELVTPPVECGLLAGTYRALLLERGELRERKVHLSELSGSTDLTLVNSLRGEYPARLSGPPIRYLHGRDAQYHRGAVG
ncbi:MAG: chorismate-binding protein, partial [Woeseia sp.]